MANPEPPLYLDECVALEVGERLRRAGLDVVTAHECGTLGASDEAQLELATRMGRVLVTHNARHFAPLGREWFLSGRRHAGIIIVPLCPPSEVCARVLKLLASQRSSLEDQVLWASE